MWVGYLVRLRGCLGIRLRGVCRIVVIVIIAISLCVPGVDINDLRSYTRNGHAWTGTTEISIP